MLSIKNGNLLVTAELIFKSTQTTIRDLALKLKLDTKHCLYKNSCILQQSETE